MFGRAPHIAETVKMETSVTSGQVKTEIVEEELHICGTNRFRKVPPTDYLLKVESFSLLLESGMQRVDTLHFESGGKKWKLSLHPGKKADVGGHISLSLAIEEPSNCTHNWEVNVNVKFFVLDQIRGQYLMIPDANGQERRFDRMMLEWSFPNLLSHDTFNNPSKGYLVNDCCVFGVELLGNTRHGETLSWVKQPGSFVRHWSGGGLFTWKIHNFSTISGDYVCSPVFTVGGQQWKLNLYPKGWQGSCGRHLSLFLYVQNVSTGRNLSVHYKLRLKDQIGNSHVLLEVTEGGVSRGRPELRLPELHREFALLSTSFATNNPDASSLFFWELEFKESQSSFSLFGVNTLPYIRLVGPNVKSLKDSDQMDQGDFSRLAGSMAEFIESRTKLTMGPTSTVPLSSPGLRSGS
ncbi:hypothetical protein Tsubulata_002455 [Turnera subulata]|uniref:MATH domain-containing protein n=1 Tax=Turnera subulata TaxID=218843 RepID=A0A9Q0J3J9_9ROSI|nr:hypothetical protein Tsubulata_002455 [Turnera subulata]